MTERRWADKTANELLAIALAAAGEDDRVTIESCVSELRDYRTTKHARRILEEVEDLLQEPVATKAIDHDPSAEWLAKVTAVCSRFNPATSGGCSVYLVLTWDYRGSGEFGVYVGQSALEPAERFEQHKSGYKASAAVRVSGVRLLVECSRHLCRMSRSEAEEIENALANALEDVGLEVHGGH